MIESELSAFRKMYFLSKMLTHPNIMNSIRNSDAMIHPRIQTYKPNQIQNLFASRVSPDKRVRIGVFPVAHFKCILYIWPPPRRVRPVGRAAFSRRRRRMRACVCEALHSESFTTSGHSPRPVVDATVVAVVFILSGCVVCMSVCVCDSCESHVGLINLMK